MKTYDEYPEKIGQAPFQDDMSIDRALSHEAKNHTTRSDPILSGIGCGVRRHTPRGRGPTPGCNPAWGGWRSIGRPWI